MGNPSDTKAACVTNIRQVFDKLQTSNLICITHRNKLSPRTQRVNKHIYTKIGPRQQETSETNLCVSISKICAEFY